MNNRRTFLKLGALLALPRFAVAQGKMPRIAFLYNGSRQSAVDSRRLPVFIEGMQSIGYIAGKNFTLEEAFVPNWDVPKLNAAAQRVVDSRPDVIVVTGGPTVLAVKQTKTAIPVVVTLTTDPLLVGVAASLAHPGGNFTGVSVVLDEVSPKHIEYLKLVSPKLARIAVMHKPSGTSSTRGIVEAEAKKRGLQVSMIEVNGPADLAPAFAKIAQEKCDALIILGDSLFVQLAGQIATAALRARLPSIYTGAEYPQAGGLMSYGPDLVDNFRRAAGFVDKILKGTKPGDIPFEQPTRFYLTINKKTARALGITLSNELLLRADKVIG